MILIVGAVVVLAMLVAVVVDASRLYLARRSLDAATDAAALAGVQAADLAAVYSGRGGRDLPLDQDAVRRRIDRYFDDVEVRDTVEGFELTQVTVSATEVTVRTRAVVRLPFVGPITGGRSRITVRSTSTARNRLLVQ